MKTLIQSIFPIARPIKPSADVVLRNQSYNGGRMLWNTQWQEEEDKYVLRFAVPGMTKKDLSVFLDGRILFIEEREQSRLLRKGAGTIRRKFQYSCALPDGADLNRISAKCRDGLLTITVEKINRKKNRSIKVVVSDSDVKNTLGFNTWWKNLTAKMKGSDLAPGLTTN